MTILSIPVQSAITPTTPFRHERWCRTSKTDRTNCRTFGCVGIEQTTTAGSVCITGGYDQPRVHLDIQHDIAPTGAEAIEYAAAILRAVLEITPPSAMDTLTPDIDFTKVVSNITTRSSLETLTALADALSANLNSPATSTVGAL